MRRSIITEKGRGLGRVTWGTPLWAGRVLEQLFRCLTNCDLFEKKEVTNLAKILLFGGKSKLNLPKYKTFQEIPPKELIKQTR